MRAAVLTEIGQPLEIAEARLSEIGPHDVRVRVLASGVCHTDLAVAHGHLARQAPYVLGHEGAGTVEAIGASVSRVAVGDTVITVSSPSCGRCRSCIRGEPQTCAAMPSLVRPNGFAIGGDEVGGFCGLGTFAEEMIVGEWSVVPVHTTLAAEHLALIGCGVVTGFGAVVNSAKVQPGDSVVVLGCGGVGLAAVQAAMLAGASTIVAVDPVAVKRDASVSVGATHVVDPTATSVEDTVSVATDGIGADHVIEAIGRADTMLQAWQLTRRGGTTVVVGLPAPSADLVLPAQQVLLSQRRLVGSIYGAGDVRRLFATIVRIVEAGRFDIGSMIGAVIALDDVNSAMADLQDGAALRSVIRYN